VYRNRISIKLLTLIPFLGILFLVFGCAKPGYISGGPKDLDPPVVVYSEPQQYALNFKGNKIRIDFDEYIQLKDVNRQLNVSPPIKKKPQVWIKNKSIMVQLHDTLKDTTTYTLNFGNSISDNNENNPLTNYEFVFSTGNFLDTLGIRGRILDAFTLTPDKESVLAMLYNDLSDSAPIKTTPMFTSRTDKDGYFSISNVKPGKYNLFALKDNNLNYKYNVSLEEFGFIDSVVVLNLEVVRNKPNDGYIFPPDTATTRKDTAHKVHLPDSLAILKERNSLHIDLFTFLEKNKQQYISNYGRKYRHHIELVFNNDIINDSIKLRLQYFPNKNWYMLEPTNRPDSILAWITDTSLLKVDTLKTIVNYWGTNKKGDTIWKSDTLNFRYSGIDKLKKGKKAKPPRMKINWDNGPTADLNVPLLFEFQYPLDSIDYSKIIFIEKVDSTTKDVKYEVKADSLFYRDLNISTSWDEGANYEIKFLPGAFKNIYNIEHDTTIYKFSTQKLEFYGKLIINLDSINSPVILQLIDNNKILYEKYANKSGKIVFDYLQPKNYTLKLIYDTNGDHQWTTGDYLNKRQPEKVVFYKDKINVRSNWDIDISWTP
jgi:uncharacterized protein (DUF2141 family)